MSSTYRPGYKWGDYQEPAVEKTIRSILKPGDTFVDAGANIGFYTVLASKLVGDQGWVLAFEMIPDTARILASHVQHNECRNAAVVEGALGETAGKKVVATLVDGKSGQSSIASEKGNIKPEVTTITLADKLQHIPEVDLIKMDLEGAELGALRGLGSDLQKVRAIIFENRGNRDVVEYLEQRGFDVTRLDGSNALAHREL